MGRKLRDTAYCSSSHETTEINIYLMIYNNKYKLSQKMNIYFMIYRVQSLYNMPHYKTDLDITRSCCGSLIFHYRGILQRNYRKMTIPWSFSYHSFVKLSLYNFIYL